MKSLNSLEETKDIISTVPAVLIYFSGQNCSVCKALKPKIEQQVNLHLPKIKTYEVKADIYKEIASNFSVFSIPTILVFFDSKEFKREGRNISVLNFIEELKRPYNLFMD
ncbi:MAG: thioredoxin family protein [Campylobacteraceae bacterium]|nr:thioredoxin family protein [Campylobacteraceae bacterium]